jgi:type III secretion system FlhB-like substrate exporter
MTIRKLVGVAFDPQCDAAPAVIVKGAGAEADAAIEQARREAETPIVKDAALVDALYQLPLDSPVGKELFPVMAALLVHVITVDRSRGEQTE